MEGWDRPQGGVWRCGAGRYVKGCDRDGRVGVLKGRTGRGVEGWSCVGEVWRQAGGSPPLPPPGSQHRATQSLPANGTLHWLPQGRVAAIEKRNTRFFWIIVLLLSIKDETRVLVSVDTNGKMYMKKCRIRPTIGPLVCV